MKKIYIKMNTFVFLVFGKLTMTNTYYTKYVLTMVRLIDDSIGLVLRHASVISDAIAGITPSPKENSNTIANSQK